MHVWTVRVVREEIWKIETETPQEAIEIAKDNEILVEALRSVDRSWRSADIIGKD